MPLPLAIVGGTALRFGARYASSALAAAAPEIKSKALALIKSATSGRVSTPEAVEQYAAKSPNNLAIVAINGAKAGIAPASLLPEKFVTESQSVEIQNLAKRVQTAFANSYQKIDAQSVITPDGSQETVMLSMAVINKVSDLLGIRADSALSSAHVQLRMWLAMSEGEHTQALQMRRVARGS